MTQGNVLSRQLWNSHKELVLAENLRLKYRAQPQAIKLIVKGYGAILYSAGIPWMECMECNIIPAPLDHIVHSKETEEINSSSSRTVCKETKQQTVLIKIKIRACYSLRLATTWQYEISIQKMMKENLRIIIPDHDYIYIGSMHISSTSSWEGRPNKTFRYIKLYKMNL